MRRGQRIAPATEGRDRRFDLVALDLDGTVLRRDQGIADRTVAAVGRLRAGGTRVVVATGRRFEGAGGHAARLGLQPEDPIVCYGGAMVRRLGGETLLHRTLPRDLSVEFLRWASRRGLHARVFTDGRIALGPITARAAGHQRHPAGPGVLVVRSPARWLAEAGVEATKLAVADSPAGVEGWIREARETFAGRLFLARSHPDYVEVMSPGSTKSGALGFLCERWGIDSSRVLAFGDADNDVDMLRFAGRGVAVGPTTAGVREAADEVVPNVDEDGVALFVEDLLRGA